MVIVRHTEFRVAAPDPSPMKGQSEQVKVGHGILDQVDPTLCLIASVCTSCDLTEVFCSPLHEITSLSPGQGCII